MSADSELLIAIKTALDAGGIDAAKTKLGELTNETNKASTASAGQAAAAHNAKDKLQGTLAAMGGLTSAMKDGSGATEGLSRLIGGLGRAFGSVSLVVGAALAGWKVGLEVQSFLWNKIVGDVQGLPGPIKKSRDEIDKLNATKLDKLKAEIDAIVKSTDALSSSLDKAHQREQNVRDAKMEAEISKVEETTAPGTERERKIAEIRKNYADEESASIEKKAKTEISIADETTRALVKRQEEMRINIEFAEAKFEAVQKRAAERPDSKNAATMSNARNERDSAVATFKKEIETIADEIEGNQQRKDEASSQIEVQSIKRKTSSSKYRTSLHDAEAEDEKIRQKETETYVTKEGGKEKDKAEEMMAAEREELAKGETGLSLAKDAARNYDPKKKEFRSKEKYAAAKQRDEELDTLVREATSDVAAHKAAIKEMAKHIKQITKQTQSDLETLQSQSKNKPIYGSGG